MIRTQYDAKLAVDARFRFGGLITVEDNGSSDVRFVIERNNFNNSWIVVSDAMIPRDIAISLVAGKAVLKTETV